MKRIVQVILAIATLVVLALAYSQLQAKWEQQDRVARIDQVIEERIAWRAAETAYRNKFAEQLHRQALQNERESDARWAAAKERGKLPVSNTVPTNVAATNNRPR